MFLQLVVFPILDITNLVMFSKRVWSLTPICVWMSFLTTVLYIPRRRSDVYCSSLSSSTAGREPVQMYCWSRLLRSSSAVGGLSSKNSLNDRGSILISAYRPEMYVARSEDRRYAFDPVT